ncbi:cell division protein FtsZ [Mycoplasma struthionis]|uniref:Cell division protein FtsZ n=1 Tax=Mycoplasma struthionis TaxID=538220 RepID=A0A3G8LIS5_9MOLU|nr:cell division protein FtsZ [Mycoplasma struthionis]AZG68780.1 cell division protein FtsZ [Mycoplasma struthionis]TPI01550.1 cell division protein FtsZ [Mycoplasma struthionis]
MSELVSVAKIKIFGIGGCGNNSLKSMANLNVDNVEMIFVNTDKQALASFEEHKTLNIGGKQGIGAGAKPEVGYNQANKSREEIANLVKDTDLVVITAGMGGGTGTGASPVFAEEAKKAGALVVAVVTTPFNMEGKMRQRVAEEGIETLRKYVDSYIVISNQKLLNVFGNLAHKAAFEKSNKVLQQVIRTLVDVIAKPCQINVDFADLKTILQNKGEAVVGIGKANGEKRAEKAMINAISSPILQSKINGAKNALVTIFASAQVTLQEFDIAIKTLEANVGNDINIILGVSTNENESSEALGDLYISVIATDLADPSLQTLEESKSNFTDETRSENIKTNSESFSKESSYGYYSEKQNSEKDDIFSNPKYTIDHLKNK